MEIGTEEGKTQSLRTLGKRPRLNAPPRTQTRTGRGTPLSHGGRRGSDSLVLWRDVTPPGSGTTASFHLSGLGERNVLRRFLFAASGKRTELAQRDSRVCGGGVKRSKGRKKKTKKEKTKKEKILGLLPKDLIRKR